MYKLTEGTLWCHSWDPITTSGKGSLTISEGGKVELVDLSSLPYKKKMILV